MRKKNKWLSLFLSIVIIVSNVNFVFSLELENRFHLHHLSGVVLDQWENPVVEANFSISTSTITTDRASTLTAEDGAFYLNLLWLSDPRPYYIKKDGYKTINGQTTLLSDVNLGTFYMYKEFYNIQGKVINHKGEAISNVTVIVNNKYDGITDEQGMYDIEIPEAEKTVTSVSVNHNDYDSLIKDDLDILSDTIIRLGDIILQNEYVIQGTIKDQWGNIVQGVNVSFNGVSTTTNSIGQYTLEVKGTTDNLVISKNGYTTTTISKTINSDTNLGTMTLNKNYYNVQGQVVNSKGQAIPNATVKINSMYSAVTNSSGVYEIEIPSSETKITKIETAHNEYNNLTYNTNILSDEVVNIGNITLKKNYITTGIIVNQWGNKVDGVIFTLNRKNTSTNGNGYFTLSQEEFTDSKPYTLSKSGYANKSANLVLDEDKNLGNVTFIKNNYNVQGQVVNSKGQAIPNATVKINSTYSAVTNSSGVYDVEIPSSETKITSILVSHSDFDTKSIALSQNYDEVLSLSNIELDNANITFNSNIEYLSSFTNYTMVYEYVVKDELNNIVETNSVTEKEKTTTLKVGKYTITFNLPNAEIITKTVDLVKNIELDLQFIMNSEKPIYEIDKDNPIEAPKRILTLNTNVKEYDLYLKHNEMDYEIEIPNVENNIVEIPIMYSGMYEMVIEKQNYEILTGTLDLAYSNEYDFNLYVTTEKPIYEIDKDNPIEAPKRILTLNTNISGYDVRLEHNEMDYEIERLSIEGNTIEVPILYSGEYEMTMFKDNYDTVIETLDLTYSNEYNFNMYATTGNPIYEIDPNNPIEVPRRMLTLNTNIDGYDLHLKHSTMDYEIFLENVLDEEIEVPILYSGVYDMQLAKDYYHTYTKTTDLTSSSAIDVELYAISDNPIIEWDDDNKVEAPKRILTLNTNIDGYDLYLKHSAMDYEIEVSNVEDTELEIPILYSGTYEMTMLKENYDTINETLDLTHSNTYDFNLYVTTEQPIYEIDKDNPVTAPRRILTLNTNVGGYDVNLKHNDMDYEIEVLNVEDTELEIPILYSGNYNLEARKNGHNTIKEELYLYSSTNFNVEFIKRYEEEISSDTLEEFYEVEEKEDINSIVEEKADEVFNVDLLSDEEYFTYVGKLIGSNYDFLYFKAKVDANKLIVEYEDRVEEIMGDTNNYINQKTYSTMIPLRHLIESSKINPIINWNNNSKVCTIIFEEKDLIVKFELGSNLLKINDRVFEMVNNRGDELMVEENDNRLLIPFRYIGEFMHFEVYYDEKLGKAVVENK